VSEPPGIDKSRKFEALRWFCRSPCFQLFLLQNIFLTFVRPLLRDRKVDVRLPGKGNSNSHGARQVHLIITMIKWIRTSRLSIKNSLSFPIVGFDPVINTHFSPAAAAAAARLAPPTSIWSPLEDIKALAAAVFGPEDVSTQVSPSAVERIWRILKMKTS